MAAPTIEGMLSHSALGRQRKQNVGNTDGRPVSAVMWATAISPGRRCEARMGYRCQGVKYPFEQRDLGLRGRGQDPLDAWQCIACAEIVDPEIVTNRNRIKDPRTCRPP